MWHTKMWPVSDRAEESSLQFIHADEVNAESEDHVVGNISLNYIVLGQYSCYARYLWFNQSSNLSSVYYTKTLLYFHYL
ncbi:hypothetical protein AtEden1_Chr4g0277221 [Arabidopsis thaliana]